VSGSTVTFNVATGEGAKIKPGHVLSIYGSTDEDDSHALFVLSVSTDAITAVNGFRGSPAVADTNLDGALLEQNPFQLEYQIHKRIDTVFASLLYPSVYQLTTASVTPDLSDGQVEVPAAVERITEAVQSVGGTWITIPFSVTKDVSTSVSSTGSLGTFDAVNGNTVYYTYMEKVGVTSTDESVIEMVSLGAAALLLGASVSENANAESQARPRNIGQDIWRDFVTVRASFADQIAEDTALGFEIHRG
jgi:hypothetical protein